MSFKGQYNFSLDTKGRLNIPSKLRKALSPDANDSFTVSRGLDQCVYIHPSDEWKLYEQRLRKLSTTKARNRKFLRMTFSMAFDDTMDKQGRITIPAELLKYAEIDKEVLVIGMIDKIELWNPEKYEKFIDSSEESYEDIAEDLLFDE